MILKELIEWLRSDDALFDCGADLLAEILGRIDRRRTELERDLPAHLRELVAQSPDAHREALEAALGAVSHSQEGLGVRLERFEMLLFDSGRYRLDDLTAAYNRGRVDGLGAAIQFGKDSLELADRKRAGEVGITLTGLNAERLRAIEAEQFPRPTDEFAGEIAENGVNRINFDKKEVN